MKQKFEDNHHQRKGPYPLLAHLGMVVASSLELQTGIHEYAAPFFAWKKEGELEEVIKGIQMYLRHPYKAQQEKGKPIWKEGNTSVLELYGQTENSAHQKTHSALLLVPSLINSSAIFDLCPERSMARFMRKSGNAVYVLDWGDTAKDKQALDLSATIQSRLLPALRSVREHAQKPVSVLGYCMGGTLSLAAAAIDNKDMDRLVLLAAPWDFRAGKNILSDRVRGWAPLVLPQTEQKGYLPSEWTQALFATLDSEGSARKFARFAKMKQDSLEARLFIAVEDWLNEGMDLAPAIGRDILQQWFALNAPVRGEWKIGQQKIDLATLVLPVLMVASNRDRLVPYEAAEAVAAQMKAKKTQTLPLECGHIGLMAGRGAVENVWAPIARWLSQ